jgi:hypothetical protein
LSKILYLFDIFNRFWEALSKLPNLAHFEWSFNDFKKLGKNVAPLKKLDTLTLSFGAEDEEEDVGEPIQVIHLT